MSVFPPFRDVRSPFALIVVALLGAVLALPAPALAHSHNPDGVDPCADAPVFNEFVDREDARDAHERSIDCVLYRSIAVGFADAKGDPVYYPMRELTRAQMATFIAQTLDAGGSGEKLPDGTGADAFDDIADSTHRRNINRLARAGIIRGTSRREFSVHLSVTRQQMASFIVQAAEFALDEPVPNDGVDRFTDVSESNVHKDNIEAGADAEPPLMRGAAEDRFNPGERVLRDQMASFLVNLLRYVFNPELAPKPVAVSLDQTSIRGGQTLTGSAVGDDVTSASVSGDCVTNGPVEDTNEQTAGIQFALDIPFNARTGACNLQFMVAQTVGEQQTVRSRTVAVTIAERPPKQQTSAPELRSAAFVRETTNEGQLPGTVDDFQQTTMRFTFDEPVTTTLAAEGFTLVTYDVRRFTGQTAARDSSKEDSVLVVFGSSGSEVGAAELSDVTAAVVDFGAARDADGNRSPEGDASVNSVTLQPGVTHAPDVRTLDNYRPGEGTAPTTTLVDVSFDQPAYVVDEAGFELILVDNTEIECAATPGQDGGFQGDGTTVITVACSTTANAGQQIPPADVSRGVVQAGAVSNSPQDDLPGADGTTNPLQTTDEPDVVSTAPDLVTVDLHPDNTATFTFDQPVVFVGDDRAATGGRFRLYDHHGVGRAGSSVAPQDGSNPDATVVVTFPAGLVDTAVGGAVEQDAVRGVNRNPQQNQEDEQGVTSAASYEAGFTVAPDLVDVERAVTGRTTDPVTGETTPNEVTFTLTLDEEVATVAEGFFIYGASNERVALTRCARSGAAGPGDDDEVVCVVSRRGGGADVNNDDADDLAEGFAAAQAAVLGTVDNGAATDSESNANREGALAVIDA